MASATLNRTINVCGRGLLKEGKAGEVIKVGSHVVIDSAGEVMLRDTGHPTHWIVGEAPERGKGLFKADGSIETYADGEQIAMFHFAPGDETFVLLATGQNITRGNFLEAAANGEWVVLAAGVAGFIAKETLNNTSGAAVYLWAEAV